MNTADTVVDTASSEMDLWAQREWTFGQKGRHWEQWVDTGESGVDIGAVGWTLCAVGLTLLTLWWTVESGMDHGYSEVDTVLWSG